MSDLKKLLVIICATSGAQKDVKPPIEKVLKKSGSSYEIKKVKTPPEIRNIIKQRATEFEAIAVYGGDGSVNTAIKSLADSETKLLILSGGTGNVIAADAGVPKNPTELIKLYLRGKSHEVLYDIAKVNDEKLALDMYIGWWAEATIKTPRSLKQGFGQLAYGLSALKHFSKSSLQPYEIEVDGKKKRLKGYTAVVANRGAQVFLGVQLFPQKHRPGLVRVAVVKSISPIRFTVWIIGRLFTNRNLGGLIKTYKGNQIIIHKAPRELLYDDLEMKLELPSKVTGGEYETKLIVPVAPVKVSLYSKLLLSVRLVLIRLTERVRNVASGTPYYKYSQLAPRLFLGGGYRSKAYGLFKNWGITGIINMRSSAASPAPKGFEILQLSTPDWNAPSISSLNQGVKFAQEHISNGGGVYIHCRQGEGRGPVMAAAYLVSKGLSVEQAIDHIKRLRPVAHPNKSQIKRLHEWQAQLTQPK